MLSNIVLPKYFFHTAIAIGSMVFGIYFTHLFYDARISKGVAVEAKKEKEIATITLAAHIAAVEKLEAARDAALKKYLEQKNETSRIRTAALNDAISLRVAARATSASLQSAADSFGLEAGTCELDSTSRQNYFALREAIDDHNYLLDLAIKTLEAERDQSLPAK